MHFTRMISGAAVVAGLSLSALQSSGVAQAQGLVAGPSQGPQVTANDPIGALPDASHLPFVLPKDIKWTGDEGKHTVGTWFGDPDKPGYYGVIYKWWPGYFSKPHFHDQERWAYVVSGTWWVSTSNVYDEKKTYPLKAGTTAIDVQNTVHWDGARAGEKEPAIILVVGIGPVKTIPVGTDGKPVPPAQK